MRNSFIITKQELKNRIRSRFFWIMLVLGPIIVLSSIYVLFKLGDEGVFFDSISVFEGRS